MKVALVYDRLNKFGGAERLLLALHRLYPSAPIYTLVHEPQTSEWAKGLRIMPTFLNSLPFLRSRHEWLAPVAPLAFETLNLSPFDLVISLTSSDAKSVITKPHQLHLCYCLTPTRYFWSGASHYAGDRKMKWLPTFLKKYFTQLDLITSTRPDHYLAISQEVQKRVKKYYKRESTVVYPSIEDKFYSKKPIPFDKRKHFLIVSRLVPYKRVDLAISAFNLLKLPLVVVGTGSELKKLKQMAGSNISFAEEVSDERLIKYYREAKAVIFPQEEDFGLVPLEAQALGTPVIAYGKGGALETIIDGQTGLFFPEQTAISLISAIEKFTPYFFKQRDLHANAARFRFSTFSAEFKNEVKRLRR
jgi:glycosyltransferase involved in cell wall biosynthesis